MENELVVERQIETKSKQKIQLPFGIFSNPESPFDIKCTNIWMKENLKLEIAEWEGAETITIHTAPDRTSITEAQLKDPNRLSTVDMQLQIRKFINQLEEIVMSSFKRG